MKHVIRVVILLIFFCISAGAQTQKTAGQPVIDSLLKELDSEKYVNKEDSGRAGLLDLLSLSYAIVNTVEGIRYGEQGLALSEKLRWKKGIAAANNSLGSNYFRRNEYSKALGYFSAALKVYEETGDKSGVAATCGYIATFYSRQSDYRNALKYLLLQLKAAEEVRDKRGLVLVYRNIGLAYSHLNDYPKALENHFKSLRIAEEMGDKREIASTTGQISIVYEDMGDYTKAKEYLFKGLKVSNTSSIADFYGSIGASPSSLGNDFKALKKREELGNLATKVAIETNNGLGYKSQGDSARALEYMLKEALSYEYEKKATQAKTEEERQKLKFEQQLKEKQIEYEFAQKTALIEAQQQRKEQERKNNDAIEKVNQEKKDAIAKEELRREKSIRYAAVGGSLLLLVIAIIAIGAFRQKHKDHIIISNEKQRSEELLLNILPAEVAEELKDKGSAAARHFDDVTVLFTDFVGFTQISERMDPQALIDELHTCFKTFDEITGRYHIEKIKTIGDAYLAVCGLPIADAEHAAKVVNAAIEIMDFMQKRHEKLGGKTFEIRIGIHSGSVVAGIVGVKKFAYDIWGDTVNTAARMEQSSEPGKINISGTTYALVKNKFKCEYRGEIDAKNKGMMKMYYVSSPVASSRDVSSII